MEEAAAEIQALADRFQDSRDLVCIFDENDVIVYANQAFWEEYSWLDRSDPALDFQQMFVEGSLRELRETARSDDEEIYKYAVYANWWRRTFPNDVFYRRHVSGRLWQVRQWRSNTGLHIQVRHLLTEAEQEELSERGVLDGELPAFVDHTGFVKEGHLDEVSYVTTTIIDHIDPPVAIIDANGMIIHAGRRFIDSLMHGTAFSFDAGRLTPNSEYLAQQYNAMLQAAFSPTSSYPGGTILLSKGNDHDPQFLHLERVGMIEGRSGQWPAIVVVRLGTDDTLTPWQTTVDSHAHDGDQRLMTFDLPEAWADGPPEDARRRSYQAVLLTRAVEWMDQPIIVLNDQLQPVATNAASRQLFRRSKRWRLEDGRPVPANRDLRTQWLGNAAVGQPAAQEMLLPGFSHGVEPWRIIRLPRPLRHYSVGSVLVLVGPRPSLSANSLNRDLKDLLGLDRFSLQSLNRGATMREHHLDAVTRNKLGNEAIRDGIVDLTSLRRCFAKVAKR